MRDPRDDPKPGDVLQKNSPSSKPLFRCVTGRKGFDIYYTKGKTNAGRIKNCWISTWQTWATGATIIEQAP